MIPKNLIHSLVNSMVGNFRMEFTLVSRQLPMKVKTAKFSLPTVSESHFIPAMLSTVLYNCYCSSQLENWVSASKRNSGTVHTFVYEYSWELQTVPWSLQHTFICWTNCIIWCIKNYKENMSFIPFIRCAKASYRYFIVYNSTCFITAMSNYMTHFQ